MLSFVDIEGNLVPEDCFLSRHRIDYPSDSVGRLGFGEPIGCQVGFPHCRALPEGRALAFERLLEEDLENRVLDFDSAAATEAAALAATRQRAGRPVDMSDTQIAGIALARRATLAACNVRHFQDLSVTVIDPLETKAR